MECVQGGCPFRLLRPKKKKKKKRCCSQPSFLRSSHQFFRILLCYLVTKVIFRGSVEIQETSAQQVIRPIEGGGLYFLSFLGSDDSGIGSSKAVDVI